MKKTKRNRLLSSKRRVTRRVTRRDTRTRKRKKPDKQRRKTMIYRRQTKRYRRKKYRTKKSQRGGAEEPPVETTGNGTKENPYRVTIYRTKLYDDSTTVVYECKHGEVVKSLKVDKTQNERAIQKEVTLHTACLPHDNILGCYGYGDFLRTDGSLEKGILLEKCLIDLESLVRNTITLPDKQTVISIFHEKMQGVSSALEHIHSINIIHRDIKPSNIIACFPPEHMGQISKCTFKLFDFGEAYDSDTLRSIGDLSTLKNTPCYSGPLEQVAGKDMNKRKIEDRFKLLLTWVDVLAISSRTDKNTKVFPFGCFGSFVEGGAGKQVSDWEELMGQDPEYVVFMRGEKIGEIIPNMNADCFGGMSLEDKNTVMSKYVKLKPHNTPVVEQDLKELSEDITAEVDKALHPDTPDSS